MFKVQAFPRVSGTGAGKAGIFKCDFIITRFLVITFQAYVQAHNRGENISINVNIRSN